MGEPRRHQSSDLYEVLEVSPRASQKVIQAAYRALVQYAHPDVNSTPEAGPRVRQLNAAYRVLGNSERRARYDLECTRARRNRPAVNADRSPVTPIPTEPARTRVLLVAAPPKGRVEERRPMLTGGAVLVLMTVAALTALFLVLIWASLDPAHDEPPMMYDRSVVQLSGR